MVSSTTPRFGPKCPPVCESTRINSSRTSCASCGRSCSRSAFMSAGEWMPSSNRCGGVAVVVSEESDFVIGCFFHFGRLVVDLGFRAGLEIFNHRFARVVAGNDFDLLLGAGKSFLANFYQLHSLLVAHDHVFERQLAR